MVLKNIWFLKGDVLKIKKNDLKAVTLIIVAVFVYTFPLLLNFGKVRTLGNKNCLNDWYETYSVAFFSYANILENHQFPFWNPFHEGGFPWLTYPCYFTLNPISFLVLLCGVVKGINLSWYLFFFVGALSMFYLTRFIFKYDIYGAIYSSLAFSMSGFFAYMHMLSFWTRDALLLPLLVAGYFKAIKDKKYIIFAALILAQLIYTMLFFPVIVFFLFLIAVLNSFHRVNNKIVFDKSHIRVFVIILALAMLFSAYKILPMVEFLKVDSRISGGYYESSIEQANTMSLFIHRIFYPENFNVGTMYMGFLPVILCIFSAVLMLRLVKKWFLILIIFIILSFGPNSFFDLHYFLWHLPVFKSIKEISKYYALIIVFIISLMSGSFFSIIREKKDKKIKNILSGFIIIVTFLNLLVANIGYFNLYATDLSLIKTKKFIGHVKAINIHKGNEGGIAAMKLALSIQGFGLINAQYHKFTKYFKNPFVCPKYFVMPEYIFLVPSTKLFMLSNPGYRAEACFLNEKNKVYSFSITSGFIDIKVNVAEPDTIIINQKYSKGWKSKSGEVSNHNGLLAIDTKKTGARQSIQVYYVPLSFYIGIMISALSLLFALSLVRVNPKSKFGKLKKTWE